MEHNEKAYKRFLNEDFRFLDEKSHKSQNGRTLIIGSSHKYPTSIVLCANGAVSSGVGYVALDPLDDSYNIVATRAPLQCIYDNETEKCDSILFGNGVVDSLETKLILATLIASMNHKQTLVIDASGIEIFKKLGRIEHQGPILLTPHLGEARVLLDLKEIPSDINILLDKAKHFAYDRRVNILIKSHESYLVTENCEVSPSFYHPTAALAKAGSGDVLAGFLAGLLARYSKKPYSLKEIVLFGDWLFHYAMHEYERHFGNAVISAVDFPKALRNLLLNGILMSRGNLPYFVDKD